LLSVKFNSKLLQKCFEKKNEAVKKWGIVIAENYIKRIETLQAVEAKEDLYKIPQLNFHPLKGEKKGQFGINLTGKMRMIVSFEDNDTIVNILEVIDYH
jgi:toxin HigB-1